MADIEFNKSKGTLRCFGKVYTSNSGITDTFDPIPNGNYTIPPSALMVGSEKVAGAIYDPKYNDTPYQDSNKFAWFLWIKGAPTSNYGIHPDGNVPGTKGCIGVTTADTRPLFNQFLAHTGTTLTLAVGLTFPGDEKEDEDDVPTDPLPSYMHQLGERKPLPSYIRQALSNCW